MESELINIHKFRTLVEKIIANKNMKIRQLELQIMETSPKKDKDLTDLLERISIENSRLEEESKQLKLSDNSKDSEIQILKSEVEKLNVKVSEMEVLTKELFEENEVIRSELQMEMGSNQVINNPLNEQLKKQNAEFVSQIHKLTIDFKTERLLISQLDSKLQSKETENSRLLREKEELIDAKAMLTKQFGKIIDEIQTKPNEKAKVEASKKFPKT